MALSEQRKMVRYLSLMVSTSALSKEQCFSAMDTRHLSAQLFGVIELYREEYYNI